MTKPAFIVAVLALLASVVFFIFIVFAINEKGMIDGFQTVLATWWGKVSLADLYLGFAFTSIWIFTVEKRGWRSIGLIAILFLLGNLFTLLYLAWRLWRFRSVNQAILGTPRDHMR